MFEYNRDISTRDKIIFGEYNENDYKDGAIKNFRFLSFDKLKKLVEEKFADPDEVVNESPTIAEYISFMKSHQNFTAHGYCVGTNRDDYRVSIEGLETGSPELTDGPDLIRFLGKSVPDELNIDVSESIYFWYD